MLATTIILVILEFIFYIFGIVLAFGGASTSGVWVLFYLIAACGVISIPCLAFGISSIKVRLIRGRAIAITVLASVAILSCLTMLFYLYNAIHGVFIGVNVIK